MEFTPISYSQFLVDKLIEDHESLEIISMTVLNIVSSLSLHTELLNSSAIFFSKMIGTSNLKLDLDI